MRVPHYATRALAAIGLIGLMTGCGGGDSTGPSAPFDPAGTTSDLGALEASFESEAMTNFYGAAPAIGAALGESSAAMAVRAAPSRIIATDEAGARRHAGALARLYTPGPGMRPFASRAAILQEHLGVTFTRDPETLEYGPSGRSGAPSNGARFVVYAVDPISGQPVTPLAEVGYADVVVTEGTNSGSVRIKLVSGGVTYLDYAVGAAIAQNALSLTVSGFVSNGHDRVNFDLDTRITETKMTLGYTLSVPTRGNFRLVFEEEVTNTTMSSSLTMRGPHGTIRIEGSRTTSAGSYEVKVNGEAFATIAVTQGAEPVITGANGAPLSEEELEALRAVFLIFLGGFEFFGDLLGPMAGT